MDLKESTFFVAKFFLIHKENDSLVLIYLHF